MGAITDRADELVAQIKAAGVARATTDVREAVGNSVLVVPVPRWSGFLLGGAATVTWTVVVVGSGVGDRATAAGLEELLLKVVAALPVETADPGSYKLPNATDPLPCYTVAMTEDIDITIEESLP